jgi:hypothetical protein
VPATHNCRRHCCNSTSVHNPAQQAQHTKYPGSPSADALLCGPNRGMHTNTSLHPLHTHTVTYTLKLETCHRHCCTQSCCTNTECSTVHSMEAEGGNCRWMGHTHDSDNSTHTQAQPSSLTQVRRPTIRDPQQQHARPQRPPFQHTTPYHTTQTSTPSKGAHHIGRAIQMHCSAAQVQMLQQHGPDAETQGPGTATPRSKLPHKLTPQVETGCTRGAQQMSTPHAGKATQKAAPHWQHRRQRSPSDHTHGQQHRPGEQLRAIHLHTKHTAQAVQARPT